MRVSRDPRDRVIAEAFRPLAELPCWGVKRGYGTFLTFEFGSPKLVVREPIVASAGASERVRRLLARRNVYVSGQWHLWIYCCEWEVYEHGRKVGDSSSPGKVDRAARLLNGQKLTAARLSSRGVRTTLEFDLGARLETAPYDRTSEQWNLYEPSGDVLTLRAGGYYRHQPGTTPEHLTRWQKLRRRS